MVLCNSQREEGLVPSQICRTSNLVIPQNYKINLEPIFNFLRLFYLIIVEKASMSRSAEKTFFTSAQVAQKLFFIMLLLDKLARSCTLGNAQNERAAIIERWCSKGIGDVAPTSTFCKSTERWFCENEWTCTGLHCLPICEGAKYGSNLFPTWE